MTVNLPVFWGGPASGNQNLVYWDEDFMTARYTPSIGTITSVGGFINKAFVVGEYPCLDRVYWEVEIVTLDGLGDVGIVNISRRSDYVEGGDNFFAIDGVAYASGGSLIANGSSFGAVGTGAWVSGDVLMFAFNVTTGALAMGRNGTWADTPPAITRTVASIGTHYFPALYFDGGGQQAVLRVAEAEFDYAIPANYQALDQGVNLPGTVAGAGTDPYWDDVVFLGGFDGADADQPTPEESDLALVLTYTGADCEVVTAAAVVGTGAVFVDNGDYVSWVGADMGPIFGDFTVEGFVHFLSFGGWDGPIGDFTNGTGSWGFLRQGTDDRLQFAIKNSSVVLVSSTVLVTATDYHIAVSREGDTTRLFIDGVLEDTVTGTLGLVLNYLEITNYIGRNGVGDPMHGYVDEVRITKAARYIDAFTTPSAKFPRD